MPGECGMLISRMVTYESNCNVGHDEKINEKDTRYLHNIANSKIYKAQCSLTAFRCSRNLYIIDYFRW
jgi:hypothetical protein